MGDDDLITRTEAILNGVTAGPWECRGNIWSDPDGAYKLVARIVPGDIKPTDAEFIASARTLVPELLAEVKKLRGALLSVLSSNAPASDGDVPDCECKCHACREDAHCRRSNYECWVIL